MNDAAREADEAFRSAGVAKAKENPLLSSINAISAYKTWYKTCSLLNRFES